MNARLRTFCAGWLALLLSTALAHAEIFPLAVTDGCCDWVMPGGGPPCFLVVGSLGASGQTFKVSIRTEATQAKAYLSKEPQHDDSAAFHDLAVQAERCRRLRLSPAPLPPAKEPAQRRTFSIFMAERGLDDPDNYGRIVADLCKVGKHVQVYLDCRDPLTQDLEQAVSDALRTFDEEVYPFSLRNLGRAADVDRDGRFTILFSSCLSRLHEGKVSLDGFVRGSDFLPEFGPPFSNCCDVLYLNARLKAGPHLRTVLAHEFTHAVAFSEHMLHNPPDCRLDEEGWLSEGLAHLVEDMHHYGWSNLDYRIRAFLAQPHRYPLVVPDYYGSGLWRNPGTRGSTFLFLRCCQLRCADLPRRLIQSPFVGVRNVEFAMRQPFAELFRAWGVSLILNDGDDGREKEKTHPLLENQSPRSSIPRNSPMFRGPSFQTITDGAEQFVLAGSSMKYFLVPQRDARNQRFRIQADPSARLQVTLVQLDRQRGVLELQCRPRSQGDGLQLEATALGSSVRLEKIFCEKLLTQATGRNDISSKDLVEPGQGPFLTPGEKWSHILGGLVPAPRDCDLLISIVGSDNQGRTVVGWDLVTPR